MRKVWPPGRGFKADSCASLPAHLCTAVKTLEPRRQVLGALAVRPGERGGVGAAPFGQAPSAPSQPWR